MNKAYRDNRSHIHRSIRNLYLTTDSADTNKHKYSLTEIADKLNRKYETKMKRNHIFSIVGNLKLDDAWKKKLLDVEQLGKDISIPELQIAIKDYEIEQEKEDDEQTKEIVITGVILNQARMLLLNRLQDDKHEEQETLIIRNYESGTTQKITKGMSTKDIIQIVKVFSERVESLRDYELKRKQTPIEINIDKMLNLDIDLTRMTETELIEFAKGVIGKETIE